MAKNREAVIDREGRTAILEDGRLALFTVAASAHDKKTVRVERKLSLTGRSMAVSPEIGGIRLSSKITNTDLRNELKRLGEAILGRFEPLGGLVLLRYSDYASVITEDTALYERLKDIGGAVVCDLINMEDQD